MIGSLKLPAILPNGGGLDARIMPPKPARQACSSTQEANQTRAEPRKMGYCQSMLQFPPSQCQNQMDKHAAAPSSGVPAVRVDGLESDHA